MRNLKKIFLSIILLSSLFLLTGCSTEKEEDLNQKAVSVSSSEDILVYLPSDYLDSGLLKISFVYFKDELTAPVSKGDKVGKIVIRYGDDIISVHDIITSEDVERDNFMYAMDSIRSFIFSRSAASSLICFVLTILLYIFIASRKSSVKRKRKNISMYRY